MCSTRNKELGSYQSSKYTVLSVYFRLSHIKTYDSESRGQEEAGRTQ